MTPILVITLAVTCLVIGWALRTEYDALLRQRERERMWANIHGEWMKPPQNDATCATEDDER